MAAPPVLAAAPLHNNWVRVTNRRPFDVQRVLPGDSPGQLKYVGPMMAQQLEDQNVTTLQELIDALGALPNRDQVRLWLEAALANAKPFTCVGAALPARNHGQPNRYYVRLVNKFAYNAVVTWLAQWWDDNNRFYYHPHSHIRHDKLPPLLTDRPAAGPNGAFPPICGPPAPPPPPPPPPPPAPDNNDDDGDDDGDGGENGNLELDNDVDDDDELPERVDEKSKRADRLADLLSGPRYPPAPWLVGRRSSQSRSRSRSRSPSPAVPPRTALRVRAAPPPVSPAPAPPRAPRRVSPRAVARPLITYGRNRNLRAATAQDQEFYDAYNSGNAARRGGHDATVYFVPRPHLPRRRWLFFSL